MGAARHRCRRVDAIDQLVIAMDEIERQRIYDRAHELLAERPVERADERLAEQHERRLIAEPLQPLQADWSRCRTVAEMSQLQFDQWCRDGQPMLAREREEIARRSLEKRIAAAAATPAPAAMTEAWAAYIQEQLRLFAEIVGEEIGSTVAQAKREFDQKITELKNELAVLKAEVGVAAEVQALRHEIEQLRVERRGLRAIS
jgi:hypothetical protein